MKLKKIILYFVQVPLLHLILIVSLIWPLLVVFRMKNTELGYIFSKNNAQIKSTLEKNKKLKAQQAQMLSVTNLQQWALKYNFALPTQEQIIFL